MSRARLSPTAWAVSSGVVLRPEYPPPPPAAPASDPRGGFEPRLASFPCGRLRRLRACSAPSGPLTPLRTPMGSMRPWTCFRGSFEALEAVSRVHPGLDGVQWFVHFW